MSTRLHGPRRPSARRHSLLCGWFLLVLLLQAACVTGVPRGGMLVGLHHGSRTPPPAPSQDVTLTPGNDFAPIRMSDAQFRQTFTQLVLEVPLRIASRLPLPLAGRLVRASWPSGGARDSSVEGGYAHLCERRGSPGGLLLAAGRRSS